MSKIKISAVINTWNEEQNLEDCLKSLHFCDEIIVVDMASEDKTVEIAKKYTHKVFEIKNVGFVEPARNLSLSKAVGDWILVVDADERVPRELAQKLISITKEDSADFVRLPRKNIVFGQWLKYSRWWPDYNVRFFKKGAVTWQNEIHSVPITQGSGINLDDQEGLSLEHLHYQTIDQYLLRSIRYADQQAKELIQAGYVFDAKDLVSKPIGEFLSRFFAGEGYRDGLHGFIMSALQYFSILLVYIKIWQIQGNKKITDTAFSSTWVSVFQDKFKEFRYWYLTFKVNTTKSKAGSVFYKILRRSLPK